MYKKKSLLSGYAKHNHYALRFYMRLFSCVGDVAKV